MSIIHQKTYLHALLPRPKVYKTFFHSQLSYAMIFDSYYCKLKYLKKLIFFLPKTLRYCIYFAIICILSDIYNRACSVQLSMIVFITFFSLFQTYRYAHLQRQAGILKFWINNNAKELLNLFDISSIMNIPFTTFLRDTFNSGAISQMKKSQKLKKYYFYWINNFIWLK